MGNDEVKTCHKSLKTRLERISEDMPSNASIIPTIDPCYLIH